MSKPKPAWDSWYDDELVTAEGEAILAHYDDRAIAEFHRMKLIWKSWGKATSLGEPVSAYPGMPSFDLRELNCGDPSLLRLFFLSLLWRAAATSRPEFHGVRLNEVELIRLQGMMRDGEANPLDLFPTTLLQIASRGPAHNLVPLAIDNTFDLGGRTPYRHHVIRFYFDGLIANMHCSMKNLAGIEPFVVGCSSRLVVQLQLLEDSSLLSSLFEVASISTENWPAEMSVLCYGRGPDLGQGLRKRTGISARTLYG